MIVVDTVSPAHGGASIARHDGRVIFVRGALPGERDVAVELDNPESTKSFLTGHAVEIGVPSPHRVIPQCPAAALGAGCCDLDFVDEAGALEFKKDVVLDQMRRIGKIDTDQLEQQGKIHAESLGPQAGWRTRVRLGVDAQGIVGTRKRGSRDVVPLSSAVCAQLHPLLRDGLVGELEILGRDGKLRPNSDVVVSLGDDAEAHNLSTTRSIIERTDTQRRPARAKGRRSAHKAPARTHLAGPEEIVKTLNCAGDEVRWNIPGDAFWQAHAGATQRYADLIDGYVPATLAPEGSAWDLYGGAGVFAAVLDSKFPSTATSTVSVVDYASQATTAGQSALSDRVHFVTGDVAHSLPSLDTDGHLHAVVLDPPRTGAGASVIREIAKSQPAHVVHIGCDPATAARDLGTWLELGFDIADLTIVDAFGLTHHVELVANLVRR